MTIRYRDVSHYQGAYIPVGPTCAKATEGSTYIDPSYAGIRRRTLAGGWPFLPYHFLRPHTIASIASQVAHVVNVVGKTSIMLDVEKEPLDTLAEQRELVQDIYAFADQYHAAGGRVTLAYFPHWEEQAVGSPSLTGLTSRGIGLVSSNYTTYSDSGPGWAPYGGVTPIIWQYTSTPLDTNAFKGTTAQLADLWAHGIDNTDPSVPVVPPEDIVTPAEFLAILRDPAVAAEMHALPWRYIGGGIPAGMSTLNVLNALLTSAGEAADADAAEVVRDEALAATVGDLPTTTLPPGPLSGADVDRIAAAVDALIAARAARFAS